MGADVYASRERSGAVGAGSRGQILLTTSTFPLSRQDGLPCFVLDLAEALSRWADVSALAPDAPGARRRERMGSVDVQRFSYFWPRSRQRLSYGDGMLANLRGSSLAKLQSLPFMASQIASLGRILRRGRVSLVNSHWIVPQGLSASLLRAAGFEFAHVLTVHGGDLFLLERLSAGRAIARFVLDRTDYVFVAGRHIASRLAALTGEDHECDVQPMGVEPALFGGAGNETASSPFSGGYLLFVGRLVEKKGLTHLLRAFVEIRRAHPELGLIVVGYGPLSEHLRRTAEILGIDSSVHFTGRRRREEVATYLRGAEAVVVPSVEDHVGETEGMPTVVSEAMAVGARVVASAIAGIPDVIRHADNGWLCPPADVAALTSTVLQALRDPADAAVRARARETAERLFWPRVAERYFGAFEQVYRERDGSRAPTAGARLFGKLLRNNRGS